jgi:TRAP-type C4-dicarboxylate transport system permease small subunit
VAPLRTVDLFLGGCERLFRLLANLLLLTMLAINLLNIATRFLTDQGIVWVFPLTTVMFVWMTFLGFFVVYRQGKDITVDILIDRIGPARRAARVLVDLAVLSLLGVLLAEAPALLERQVGNIEMVGLQRYWLSVPFFVSCALIALHFVVDLLHALHGDPQEHHQPAGDI